MSTGKPAKQGPSIFGGLMDLLILVLLIGAAGGGGYYWGTIQRMAPVNLVAEGTPGARPAETSDTKKTRPAETPGEETKTTANSPESKTSDTTTKKSENKSSESGKQSEEGSPDENKETEKAASQSNGKMHYWLSSSGSDYIGYSITVSVNGTAVDSFFGPDKTVDITKLVNPGKSNTIIFDAKNMGAKYNKHKDDEKSALTLQLISGPFQTSNFKKSDVLLTYSRNAAESEDYHDSKTFGKE